MSVRALLTTTLNKPSNGFFVKLATDKKTVSPNGQNSFNREITQPPKKASQCSAVHLRHMFRKHIINTPQPSSNHSQPSYVQGYITTQATHIPNDNAQYTITTSPPAQCSHNTIKHSHIYNFRQFTIDTSQISPPHLRIRHYLL